MLSKSEISRIKSLQLKKFRNESAKFIAEGPKIVGELLHSAYNIIAVYGLSEAVAKIQNQHVSSVTVHEISEEELKKISSLSTPNQILAVAETSYPQFKKEIAEANMILCLDGIRDPGNLGTIIRIADWFGFRHILCSSDSVDLYNPKCIQASMGSFIRVNVYYDHLSDVLENSHTHIPVYGTGLDGKNIYTQKIQNNGFMIIGNEARGISPQTEAFIHEKLFIPPGNDREHHAESLNASVAAAVVCSEISRRRWMMSENNH
jgi:TrmH family RNA methyltransferase